ncbi:MAG: META domain-containing protein [Campylobacteraceae bacterium]|jgi:heat shock protein HslJ|nr:META domain-containing protein [Campylobacteraceae bacterium]
MKKVIFTIFLGLIIVGCAISQNGQKLNADTLENSSWVLVSISNKSLNLEKMPTLQFTQKRAAGFNGINNFSANYKLSNGNKLVFSDMITTRMAAISSELSKVEEEFVNALVNTNLFELKDDLLSIYGAGDTLVFKKIK